jgi:hypothetical protein
VDEVTVSVLLWSGEHHTWTTEGAATGRSDARAGDGRPSQLPTELQELQIAAHSYLKRLGGA